MPTKKIGIVIACPYTVVVEGLRSILSTSPSFDVLATTTSYQRALKLVSRHRARLLLIDPSLYEEGGPQLSDDTRIVAIVTHYTGQGVLKRFDAIITLESPPTQIECYMKKAVCSTTSHRHYHHNFHLSKREIEVLVCVARGLSNKAIAERLFVSITTVISHRRSIREKTGIRTVPGLTILALMNGWIEESVLSFKSQNVKEILIEPATEVGICAEPPPGWSTH